MLDDSELAPVLKVDAVVDGRDLTLGLCEELEQLAPFGLGNPGVTLLVAGSQLSELATVGDGKHLRLAVTANGSRSGAIAFGWGERLDRYRRPGLYDIAFKLDANRWNGTVAPQLVVKRIYESPTRYDELRASLAAEWRAGAEAGRRRHARSSRSSDSSTSPAAAAAWPSRRPSARRSPSSWPPPRSPGFLDRDPELH